MYTHIHTYMYTHIHTYTHTHSHTHLHTHTHTHSSGLYNTIDEIRIRGSLPDPYLAYRQSNDFAGFQPGTAGLV